VSAVEPSTPDAGAPAPPSFATADEIAAGLRALFPAKDHAVFFEVPDGTGARIRRRADALVQSLWPSRGLWLAGIEIKVARADWLRELKDPGKADAIACFCDHWYVAVSDRALVHDGELPASWGLIAPQRGALRVVVAPAQLDPVPMTPAFRAALLRAAQESGANEAQLREARSVARAEGVEAGKQHAHWEGEQARRDLKELRATLAVFDEHRVHLSTYSAAQIAGALKLYTALSGNADLPRLLEYAANHAAGVERDFRAVLAQLRAAVDGAIENGAAS
jgi:hypothetical protein